MPKLTEMHAEVTLMQQIETDVSPVVLINRFSAAQGELDQLVRRGRQTPLSSRRNRATFPRSFTGASEAVARSSMSRSGSRSDISKRAFMHPTFQGHLAGYPASAVASPHLFSKVTLPNICVAG